MLFKKRNEVKYDYSTYLSRNGAHGGVDVAGLDDNVIYCPVDGVVQAAHFVRKTLWDARTWEWGYYIRIDDANGNRHHFCHMKPNSFMVKVGQRVTKGTPLGLMGESGNAANTNPRWPHCHYEARDKNNKKINPCPFIGIENRRGVYEDKAPVAPELDVLTVGPVSKGDRAVLESLAKRLGVPCKISTLNCKAGLCKCVIGPVSKGDRAEVEALADKLLVPHKV